MLFDTHAHYDDERFECDRRDAILNAYESGVERIINASSDMPSSRASISLAQEFDFIYAAIGFHPHYAACFDDSAAGEIIRLAAEKKVVAIGEIGLDYYYDNSPRDVQKECFAKQIGIAEELGLPIIIHSREAHEDTLEIIKRENAGETGGILHCYSGSIEMARELIKNNFYIAVGGAVTFKNARRLIEVVKALPMERLLIETDCPYMTPEPFRGKRNESVYVRLVAEKVAEIKNDTPEHVAEVTTKNANELFKLGT